MLKKLTLSLVILLISSSISIADEYFPTLDSSLNHYYDTLGYGIGFLPESEQCPTCVEYDNTQVVGENSEYILNNIDIEDITTKDSNYGLVRIPFEFDRVALPPGGKVDFIYWAENTGNEDVYINKIKVFLSRYDISRGNLLNLVQSSASFEEIPLKYIVWNYPRGGYLKEYEGLGIVNANTELNPITLDSIEVTSALIFETWSATIDGDFANIEIKVRNSSPYDLNNVSFSHKEFQQTRSFIAGEEFIFNYSIAYDGSGSLGFISLTDPNSFEECVALGEHMESNYVGASLIVTPQRKEGEAEGYTVGSRVKPYGQAFCVARIPYTVYSQEMILSVDNKVLEEQIENIIAKDSSIDIPSVLGITKLPQTSKSFIPNLLSLLVGVSFLWYYLKRRI